MLLNKPQWVFFLFITVINHLLGDMSSHVNILPMRKLNTTSYVLYFHI